MKSRRKSFIIPSAATVIIAPLGTSGILHSLYFEFFTGAGVGFVFVQNGDASAIRFILQAMPATVAQRFISPHVRFDDGLALSLSTGEAMNAIVTVWG